MLNGSWTKCFKCGGSGMCCVCRLPGCLIQTHRKDGCDACKAKGMLNGSWTECFKCGGSGMCCACRQPGCLIQTHRKDGCDACKAKGVVENPGGAATEAGATYYFHGTRIRGTAESILLNGLCASQEGRLGPGVYLVESRELAAQIAWHRGHDGNACVVVCECKDPAPKTGMHPAWAGIPQPFKEYCCREDFIRVVSVELVDNQNRF